MDIQKVLQSVDKDYILSLRHQLHMYPELAFDLPKTLALIRQELDKLNIPYTEEHEKNDLSFASQHPGIMHA